MKIFNRDDIQKQYYDLEEFIENLQDLSKEFKGKIENSYIEQIDEIWCEAQNEKESLEPLVEQIENEDNEELIYEYNGGRI
jgi:flagellar biosynthesis chaperone FliJ